KKFELSSTETPFQNLRISWTRSEARLNYYTVSEQRNEFTLPKPRAVASGIRRALWAGNRLQSGLVSLFRSLPLAVLYLFPQSSPGKRSIEFAVFDRDLAIHDYILHSHGQQFRLLVSRNVAYCLWIEDDDVGKIAFTYLPAFGNAKPFGRERAAVADHEGKRNQFAIENVSAQLLRKSAELPRMAGGAVGA